MGELMRDRGLVPDVIVSSPAMRAKQTTELVKDAGGFAANIEFDDRIYEASPLRLLEVVSELDSEYDSALLVGHNPGIEGFIHYLSGSLEPMPTAALAVIALDVENWTNIDHECGTLSDIFRPRDEMGQ